MTKAIAKINPVDFGLVKTKANELTKGLTIPLKEREGMIQEFEELSKLEITEENIPKFKELRLRIVKNRTQGIMRWHKAAKDYFLKGSQFVDAIKRQELLINEQMEEKLADGENYFINIEKERLAKLQADRVKKLLPYMEGAHDLNLSGMDEDVWEAYFETKKTQFHEKAKAEEERLQKIKDDQAEAERLRKENAELNKKVKTISRKVSTEKAKIKKQDESENMNSLIFDLRLLKTKYSFKTPKNKKKYSDTCILIEKIIAHIEK